MPYWSIYFHLVWATKERQPNLVGDVAELAQRSIRSNCSDHKVIVHALATMHDHVHLAVSVPPSLSVATLVSRLKGSSSHLIRHAEQNGDPDFSWQAEFGVHSFVERQLPDVVQYIENQHTRHTSNNVWAKLERWSDDQQPASAGFVVVARGGSPADAHNDGAEQ